MKQIRKTDAGPGNYFITVDDRSIRIPLATGHHLQIEHDERFLLYKKDKSTLILIRNPAGDTFARVHKNCIHLYGKIKIAEKCIPLGRYQYKETQFEYLIFKHNHKWI